MGIFGKKKKKSEFKKVETTEKILENVIPEVVSSVDLTAPPIIQPIPAQPVPVQPQEEMVEPVESPVVEEKVEEEPKEKLMQIPVPVFVSKEDLNKMIWETHQMVKEIYSELNKEEEE